MKGGRKKTSGGSSSSDTGVQQQLHLVPPYADGMAGETIAVAAMTTEERQPEEEFEKEGEGEERENEEEGEGEKGYESYDQFGHLEIQEGEGDLEGEDAELRPKLAEGFYEIEAVRRRRVRKGQVQYLIKWRGWPETANTWEPFENLMLCSDVIDSFEESLRSGKHRSSRKRKRKSGGPAPQAKKKPQFSSAAVTYNVPAGKGKFIEDTFVIPYLDDESRKNTGETNMGGINNVEAAEKGNENESFMVPPQVEGKEQNEKDVYLSESNGTLVSNEGNVDKLAVDIQESEMSEVFCLLNGQSNVDGEEPVRAGRRIGARRRKAASVKRFKQEQTLCVTNYAAQDVTTRNTRSCGIAGQQWNQSSYKGSDLSFKNKSDNIKSTFAITEIIKPISFASSESDNVHDISVIFMAMRSDGKEVMVDNKYLKAKYPLLLINFYERHLKYTPAA